ncbi:MAG: tetratricopeptide repeat protein, partial [Pyrinomonadaceae bacterium]
IEVNTVAVRWLQHERTESGPISGSDCVDWQMALRSMQRKLSIIAVVILVAGAVVSPAKVPRIQTQKPSSEFADRPPPPVSDEVRREMESRLDEARRRYEAKPNDPQSIIWLGRRLAYLGRFREAIEAYSEGLRKFPRDARFYRHRGHRYVTLRKLDLAVDDLKKAAQLIKGKPDEVEPDGQPNVRNIPTSTLQFNIWYHLGLAHYLKGQNKQALDAYRECLKVSRNPDAVVATSHWLYMTLRRLNQPKEAATVLEPIREGMEIIENDGYYRLLLVYKGLVQPESLLEEALKQDRSAASHSVLYGIGNWHLYNGRRVEALNIFRRMLEGDQWTSFGFIAAEADLKRLEL